MDVAGFELGPIANKEVRLTERISGLSDIESEAFLDSMAQPTLVNQGSGFSGAFDLLVGQVTI